MGTLNLIYASVFLAINRFMLPIGSILLMMIIGRYDTDMLAAYVLLNTVLALFRIVATSGQAGLQTEFARLQTKPIEQNTLLINALIFFGILSFVLFGVGLFLGDYTLSGNGPIFRMAQDGLLLAMLIIPFVMIGAVFSMFLEGNGRAKIVSFVHIAQLIVEFLVIALLLFVFELTLLNIMATLLVGQIMSLIVLGIICRGQFLSLTGYFNLNSLKNLILPIKIGTPTIGAQLLIAYVSLVLTKVVVGYGSAYAAVLSTVGSLVFFVQIPITGISQQMGLDVANAHSKQQPIWPAMATGSKLIFMLGLLGLAVIFFGRTFISGLLTNDMAAQSIFIASIGCVMGYFFVSIFSMFLGVLLRAMGDYVLPSMVMSVFILGFIPYLYFVQTSHSFADTMNGYCFLVFLGDIVFLLRFLWLYKRSIVR